MSIVIAGGLTADASASTTTMAAGSEPESVEASPVVEKSSSYPHQPHTTSTTSHHTYLGLPYADHNYGAPPPPTPPASPPPSAGAHHRGEVNGFTAALDDTSNATTISVSEDGSYGVDVTRCVCGFTHDDGYMICCDKCSVWQHIDCMGIDRQRIPDTYLCEFCEPRSVDRDRAFQLQSRRRGNISGAAVSNESCLSVPVKSCPWQISHTDGDTSATESGDEGLACLAVSYTAVQQTPTSLTLTANRLHHPAAAKASAKEKKRKKSIENKKTFREGARRSSRLKNSGPDPSAGDDGWSCAWESRLELWAEQYEEAHSNHYSTDLQGLLESHGRGADGAGADGAHGPAPAAQAGGGGAHAPGHPADGTNCGSGAVGSNSNVSIGQAQVAPGRPSQGLRSTKALKAARDLPAHTLLVEYRGMVMLQQHFEANGLFFKRPYPFVLFYSKFLGTEMCVDARTFGNEARFVRRSCSPNAEVRHAIEAGLFHLYIYSLADIPKGAEITIAFDFDYSSCHYTVNCACLREGLACPVERHNREMVAEGGELLSASGAGGGAAPGTEARRKRPKARDRDSSDVPNADSDAEGSKDAAAFDGKNRRLSPLRISTSSAQESDRYEDLEDKPAIVSSEIEMESEELIAERRRKMTREERKMEAIMQVIAKMERREKRREQALERSSCSGASGKAASADSKGTDSKDATPDTADPPTLTLSSPTQDVVLVKEEGVAAGAAPRPATAAKVNRAKPRRSFSRNRTHIGQQRRRNRTTSGCSDHPPPSPDVGSGGGGGGGAEGSPLVSPSELLPQGLSPVAAAAAAAAATADRASGGEEPGLAPSPAPSGCAKANSRYPKTKKHLVSEWLSEKPAADGAGGDGGGAHGAGGGGGGGESPYDVPLRITTDPTVLATTLNSLPGLTHSPQLYATPKHYVRFGSPFSATATPRRKRASLDSSFGSCKKRWLKQAMDETAAGSDCPSPTAARRDSPAHDGGGGGGSGDVTPTGSVSPTESASSLTELVTPLKKRRLRDALEASVGEPAAPGDLAALPLGSADATADAAAPASEPPEATAPSPVATAAAPGKPAATGAVPPATPPRGPPGPASAPASTPVTPTTSVSAAPSFLTTPPPCAKASCGPVFPVARVEGAAAAAAAAAAEEEPGTPGGGEEVLRNGYGLVCSPVTPVTPNACAPLSTPLSASVQYENISSPESSPEAKRSIFCGSEDPGCAAPTTPAPDPEATSEPGARKAQQREDAEEQERPDSISSTDVLPPDNPSSSPMEWRGVGTPPSPAPPGDGAAGADPEGPGASAGYLTPVKGAELPAPFSFSPLNSNLRDLTPSHQLGGGGFRATAAAGAGAEAEIVFPGCPGATPLLGLQELEGACPLGEGAGGDGGAGELAHDLELQLEAAAYGMSPHNPPQKKKVSLLEYRKRQREAKESTRPDGPGGSGDSPLPPERGATREPARIPSAPPAPAVAAAAHDTYEPISPAEPPAEPPLLIPPPPAGHDAAAPPAKSHEKEDVRWMSPTSVERAREAAASYHKALKRDHGASPRPDTAPASTGSSSPAPSPAPVPQSGGPVGGPPLAQASTPTTPRRLRLSNPRLRLKIPSPSAFMENKHQEGPAATRHDWEGSEESAAVLEGAGSPRHSPMPAAHSPHRLPPVPPAPQVPPASQPHAARAPSPHDPASRAPASPGTPLTPTQAAALAPLKTAAPAPAAHKQPAPQPTKSRSAVAVAVAHPSPGLPGAAPSPVSPLRAPTTPQQQAGSSPLRPAQAGKPSSAGGPPHGSLHHSPVRQKSLPSSPHRAAPVAQAQGKPASAGPAPVTAPFNPPPPPLAPPPGQQPVPVGCPIPTHHGQQAHAKYHGYARVQQVQASATLPRLAQAFGQLTAGPASAAYQPAGGLLPAQVAPGAGTASAAAAAQTLPPPPPPASVAPAYLQPVAGGAYVQQPAIYLTPPQQAVHYQATPPPPPPPPPQVSPAAGSYQPLASSPAYQPAAGAHYQMYPAHPPPPPFTQPHPSAGYHQPAATPAPAIGYHQPPPPQAPSAAGTAYHAAPPPPPPPPPQVPAPSQAVQAAPRTQLTAAYQQSAAAATFHTSSSYYQQH